jgi:PAS domain S-box-containing protein
MFQMTEKELQNAVRTDLVVIEPKRMNQLQEERSKKGKSRVELTLKRKDKSLFEGEVTSNVFTDSDGITKINMIIRDVTERKKAEEILRASEEKYKSLFEQAVDYILVLEFPKSGLPIIRDANEAALKLHGYTREELINQSIKLIDKNADNIKTKEFISSLKSGEAIQFEVIHTRKDGTLFNAEVISKAIKLGEENWILSIERDITERKKAETALNSALEKLHLAAEASKSGTWEWNLVTGENMWSEETWRLYGLAPEKTKASFELWLETIHPDDREKTVQAARKASQEKKELYIEYRLSDKHGKGRWLMSRGQPQKNDDGIVDRYLGVIIDITERKKAEEALKASEAKLRLLAENMHDVVWIMDLQGRFIYVSPSIYQLRGYTAKEIEHQSLAETLTPDSLKIINEKFEHFQKTGEIPIKYLEVEQTCKDGSTVWTEVNFSVVNDENGNPQQVVGVSRDITVRKKAEQKLLQSDLIFENSLDMVCIGGFDGYFKVLNPAWSKTLGWSKEELLSKKWIEFVHPDDRKAASDSSSFLQKGKKLIQLENRYLCKDGTFKWLSWNSIPYQKDQIIFAVARDITEKKEAEDRLAAANEKLRVIGNLTRHDVRNKLTIIKSTVYLLKKRAIDDLELEAFLQDIDNAVDASNKLFEFSSVYEKIGVEKPVEIDIGEYFWQAADLLHNQTIKIVNECKGLIVRADTLIRQLFYNLLDNSCKHGKTVTEAKLYYIKKAYCIDLIYQDNGVGIPQKDKSKIFVEGFTTGNGSGLGLMLAKKMVEAYGWTITENGEEGKGARFVITIPQN